MFNNGDINAGQYERAIRTGLKLDVPSQTEQSGVQSYWVQYIEQQLEQKYGQAAVREGGLTVNTTLQPQLQHAARVAMHEVLSGPGLPAAALVSIDPRTGAIVAFDATTNPEKAKFNIPGDAQRQAGSSFKPFALTAAMVYKHIDPETTTYSGSQPFQYQLCNTGYPSCTWTVYNAEQGGGNYNLHLAMDGSINTVFARLSIDIGADSTVRMAHRLGIPGSVNLPVVPSIVLGTGLVSPLDMASPTSRLRPTGFTISPLRSPRSTRPAPTSTTVNSAVPEPGHSGDPLVDRVGDEQHPARQRHLRAGPVHGRGCAAGRWAGRGGQDRHGREPPGCVVLRLHADARHLRLDGLPAGRDLDDQHCRFGQLVRRRLSDHHLEGLHEPAFALNPKVSAHAVQGVPGALRRLPALHLAVPALLRATTHQDQPPTKKNGGGGGGTTTTGGGGGGPPAAVAAAPPPRVAVAAEPPPHRPPDATTVPGTFVAFTMTSPC